jgi:hypothetical protein
MSQSASVTQAAPAALDTYANNSSPSTRQQRWERRGLLWKESDLERVRKCGRVTVTGGGSVAVRYREGVAGFAGLATCGSVWADPVCNAKIMARRGLDLGALVVLATMGKGWSPYFGTMTMRHHKGQPLATLWAGLSAGWGAVTSGKYWQAEKVRYGVTGWVRVIELTYGVNGWHLHVHYLILTDRELTTQEIADWQRSMFGRWSRAVQRQGLRAPLLDAQDLRVVDAVEKVAEYVSKATYRPSKSGIGREMTQGQSKRARGVHGTSSVWLLLDEIALGDADALDMWHEYERTSKGKRLLTFSQGLRTLLGMAKDATDEDIASEELGSSEDNLLFITAEGWRALSRTPADCAGLLDEVERGGLMGARLYLDARCIDYTMAD